MCDPAFQNLNNASVVQNLPIPPKSNYNFLTYLAKKRKTVKTLAPAKLCWKTQARVMYASYYVTTNDTQAHHLSM